MVSTHSTKGRVFAYAIYTWFILKHPQLAVHELAALTPGRLTEVLSFMVERYLTKSLQPNILTTRDDAQNQLGYSSLKLMILCWTSSQLSLYFKAQIQFHTNNLLVSV